MKKIFVNRSLAIALALGSASLLARQAQAIVDMKNANYSNTWVDIEVPGSGYELKVARTYNSRTLLNGMFGFGWCSEYETKIEKTAEGNLKLTECGAGQETFYTPREFGRRDIDKTIAQIVKGLRESHKMEERQVKALAEEMVTNHDLRAKYALEMRIAINVREGSRFYANGREVESIELKNGAYIRSMADGSSMRFSAEGHLTHLYDKNGNYLKFDYDKGSVSEVVDNNGRKLTFKYYSNKKVKSIVGPNGITAEYKFAGLDDLSLVKNGWDNTYTYEYDELHDLTKATYPDGTFVALTYDKKNDWVTSFTDRQKCNESYKYEFSQTEPKMHYWATVKKVCGKEITNESKHEFWFKTRADGQVYLQRVSSMINGNVTDITYNEVFSKPSIIRRNNEVATFDYYSNGQVKRKANNQMAFVYDYNPQNGKVAGVVMTVMNDKGKVTQTKKTEFRYDEKGNLTFAANSDGQKVQMSYDGRGRIAKITDQAKKLVTIDYEERFGKPAVVNRPGLGIIKVSYKTNGEIDKVVSNDGPSVAMQVASAFNNLLDVIAPATAEIYN